MSSSGALSMRRKVALKILPLSKAEDPRPLAPLQRKRRRCARSSRRCRTSGDGYEAGGLHFLVIEYINGWA